MPELPIEIEKKFLIKYPDISVLEKQPEYTGTQILQTYINDGQDGLRGRVRKRGADGKFTYTKTYKRDITDMTRVEIESEISSQEYEQLLLKRTDGFADVEKERVTFVYCGRKFEVDLYPFWNDKAIMEIELESESAEIDFPPFITVIKDVTEDKSFRNSSIARFGAPI